MSFYLLIRLLCCIFIAAFLVFSYIHKLNRITQFKIEIPKLEKKVQMLLEENRALMLEIEKKENPHQLIKWLQQPQFSHLKQPKPSEVIIMEKE